MKRTILLMLLLLCAYAMKTEADPSVSNVRFSQRTDGSKVVDIYYDVSGTIPADWLVKIYYTIDGGATYAEATSLTGHFGHNVPTGTNRYVTWQAGSDAPGVEKGCRVKVVLAPPPPWDKVGIEYATIPAGSFSMGQTGIAEPVHTGTISAFEMSATEITQGQYQAVIGTNPSYFTGDDNLPVEKVSWWDAIKFCNAINAKAGLEQCYNESTGTCDFTKKGFRLPTEAEWEYACRAGTVTEYNTGDSENDLARAGWYSSNSSSKIHPVGQKVANAWGLYDMHGNVWEWCHDWYGNYGSWRVTDPTGERMGSDRVLRGGCWGILAYFCRSADRFYGDPVSRNYFVGFRVVRRP